MLVKLQSGIRFKDLSPNPFRPHPTHPYITNIAIKINNNTEKFNVGMCSSNCSLA